MEENEIQNLKEHNKKTNIKYLLIGIIILILMISFFIARVYAENYYNDKNSKDVREILINQINKDNHKIRHLEKNNTENITKIKKTLKENKKFVNEQIKQLKEKNYSTIWDKDITYDYCGKIVEYHPNEKQDNIPEDCTEIIIIEDRGYKKYNATAYPTFINIHDNTLNIFQIEYSINVLEENKYELKKELNNLIQDLQKENKNKSELKQKIKEINTNSEAVVGQILDGAIYLSRLASIQVYLSNTLTKNTEVIEKHGPKSIDLFENISKEINFPSEQQIINQDLKNDCINLMKESNPYSKVKKESSSLGKKLLLLEEKTSKICEYLEKYQKQNAIKMIERTKKEENPFLKIYNKIYLNHLIECGITFNNCSKDYLNNISSQINQSINENIK
jgi:hypothetical protein